MSRIKSPWALWKTGVQQEDRVSTRRQELLLECSGLFLTNTLKHS